MSAVVSLFFIVAVSGREDKKKFHARETEIFDFLPHFLWEISLDFFNLFSLTYFFIAQIG